MTTPLQDMQRQTRDAGLAASRNITVGLVDAVHPVLNRSNQPTGKALYDVRIYNRRGHEFKLRHVASAIPVQVGHSVFVSMLGGEHAKGAWITGLAQPAVPQTVALPINTQRPFTQFIQTDPAADLDLKTPNPRFLLAAQSEAWVVTTARTILDIAVLMPPTTGMHRVDLTGLTNWDGVRNTETAAMHSHGITGHQRHLIHLNDGAMTGAIAGISILWEVLVRMVDDGGAFVEPGGAPSVGYYASIASAVMADAKVEDDRAAGRRRWTIRNVAWPPQMAWTATINTARAMGEKVRVEAYMQARLLGAGGQPTTWSWSAGPAGGFSIVEAGQGSGLPVV